MCVCVCVCVCVCESRKASTFEKTMNYGKPQIREREITSWKVSAYDFYSRVVKYKTNERACERVSFMVLHNE